MIAVIQRLLSVAVTMMSDLVLMTFIVTVVTVGMMDMHSVTEVATMMASVVVTSVVRSMSVAASST